MITGFVRAGFAALLVLGVAGTAQASLIGQTVNASFSSNFVWNISANAATVSATESEYVLSTSDNRAIIVDIQDGFIDFQYNNVGNVALGFDDLFIVITGLTWAPDPGVIVDVTVEEFPDPNRNVGSPFGPNSADFTLDSLTFFADGTWAAQDRVRVTLITSHDLPEPASLALLGFGVLGLGVAARRRRTA